MKKTVLIVFTLLLSVLTLGGLIWFSVRTTPQSQQPATQSQVVYEGKLLFVTSCAECHGNQAQGSRKGPNLIDDYWIKGSGSFQDICTQIETGTPGKMPGWKNSLRPEDIQKLAAFILASRHTHPPYEMPAEGKKCTP